MTPLPNPSPTEPDPRPLGYHGPQVRPATREQPQESLKERILPAILAGLGLVMYGVWGLRTFGQEDVRWVLVIATIYAGAQVVAMLVAAFGFAAVLRVSFGPFWPAVLKLLAIATLPGGIWLAIPWGWLIALPLYPILLAWLFDELDLREAMLFMVLLVPVRLIVWWATVAALLELGLIRLK